MGLAFIRRLAKGRSSACKLLTGSDPRRRDLARRLHKADPWRAAMIRRESDHAESSAAVRPRLGAARRVDSAIQRGAIVRCASWPRLCRLHVPAPGRADRPGPRHSQCVSSRVAAVMQPVYQSDQHPKIASLVSIVVSAGHACVVRVEVAVWSWRCAWIRPGPGPGPVRAPVVVGAGRRAVLPGSVRGFGRPAPTSNRL